MSRGRWIALLWGWAAAGLMGYFLYDWIANPLNPHRYEAKMGFGIGAYYGIPAWMALPVFAFLGRRKSSTLVTVALMAPVVVAAALIVVFRLTR